MSVRRMKLLQGGAAPRETVTIQANGETIDIEVRGLTAGARGRILSTCMHEDESGESVTDIAKLTPAVIIACAFDPEANEPLFTEADRDALGELAAGYLDPVLNAAMRLSGLSDKAIKVAEKNSVATAS